MPKIINTKRDRHNYNSDLVWHYEGKFGYPACRNEWTYFTANVTENPKYVTCDKCKKMLEEIETAV